MRILSLRCGPKGGTLGSGTLVKFRSKFNSCLAMGPYFKDISFLGPYLTLNDSFKSPYTPLSVYCFKGPCPHFSGPYIPFFSSLLDDCF